MRSADRSVATLRHIGVDLERSGPHGDPAHRPIQVGLAVFAGPHDPEPGDPAPAVLLFRQDIGWPDLHLDPQAAAVHGFNARRVAAGRPADDVDRLAALWQQTSVADARGVPVGWDVGRADLPDFARYLPHTAAQHTHWSIDLHGVLAGTSHLIDPHRSLFAVKQEAQRYAAERLAADGWDLTWHDAGFDAAAGLLALHWLRSAAAGLHPS